MCMGSYMHMSGNSPHQVSYECLGSAELQNPRTVWVGMDLQRSSSPSPTSLQ